MASGAEQYSYIRCLEHGRDLDRVFKRTQELVEEYHTVNLGMTALQGTVDRLCDRVPTDLPAQLATIQTQVSAARDDFTLLRSQWYKTIGLVVGAVLLAAVALVLRGGFVK